MTMPRRFCALSTVGVMACCMVVSAQQPSPTFRSATLLTELDVLPVGHGGAVVTGLSAADFEVIEDGVPQVVDSVEFIDVDDAPQPSVLAGVVSNAYRSTSRVWVLVVDDLRLGRSLEAPVRSALATLVAGLAPPDLVALVPTSGRPARVLDPLPATLGEVLPRLERAGTGGRPTHVRLLVRIVPDGASWSAGDRYDVQAVAIDGHGRARSTATGSFEAASALPETPRGGHFTLGPLAPGRYQIRLAVHDVMRDRAGSVFVDVTVP